jgi:hypothetical protein
MQDLAEVAPAFIEMAHRIVWCSVATVDSKGRPRSRILHPIWQWDGTQLIGWVATRPTGVKRAHLAGSAYLSASYWVPTHDTCVADCRAIWANDDATRTQVWDMFLHGPAPVGYDPRIVPGWDSPTAEAFAALRLEPWRVRVFPGTALLGQGGGVLTWQDTAA